LYVCFSDQLTPKAAYLLPTPGPVAGVSQRAEEAPGSLGSITIAWSSSPNRGPKVAIVAITNLDVRDEPKRKASTGQHLIASLLCFFVV
jgi:hypothetical protein